MLTVITTISRDVTAAGPPEEVLTSAASVDCLNGVSARHHISETNIHVTVDNRPCRTHVHKNVSTRNYDGKGEERAGVPRRRAI